jgi:hypothetical protein
VLRNSDLAELLSREAKNHTDHRRRALERAARVVNFLPRDELLAWSRAPRAAGSRSV